MAECPADGKSGQCAGVDDRDEMVIIYRFFPYPGTLHTHIRGGVCVRGLKMVNKSENRWYTSDILKFIWNFTLSVSCFFDCN